MDDAALMCEGKSISDLLNEQQAIAHGKRPSSQALPEILAFEPLHGQKALPVRGLTMRNMSNDAGVPKLREQLRLAGKALRFIGAARARVLELERDGVATVAIGCSVDGAHTSATGGVLDIKAVGKETARRELQIPHVGQYAAPPPYAYQALVPDGSWGQPSDLTGKASDFPLITSPPSDGEFCPRRDLRTWLC